MQAAIDEFKKQHRIRKTRIETAGSLEVEEIESEIHEFHPLN